MTLSLDEDAEALLQQAMEESGTRHKSRLVRYCIAAALGHPLQRQVIFEAEIEFRRLSLLLFRKFARQFSAQVPELVEEILQNEDVDVDDEDAED